MSPLRKPKHEGHHESKFIAPVLSLSNDFPEIKCDFQDYTNATIPYMDTILVEFEYDLLTTTLADSKNETRKVEEIIESVEEVIIDDMLDSIFSHCERSDQRKLVEDVKMDELDVMGVDSEPKDIASMGGSCRSDFNGLAADTAAYSCFPVKGGLTVAVDKRTLNEDDEKAIKYGMRKRIKHSMYHGIYKLKDPHRKLVDLGYVGPDLEGTTSGGAVNTNSTIPHDERSEDELGFVKYGAIVFGFIVLLVLIALLVDRERRRGHSHDDESTDGLEYDEDGEFVNGEKKLRVVSATSKDGFEFAQMNPSDLGRSVCTHDVHECRSSFCDNCHANKPEFVEVDPEEFADRPHHVYTGQSYDC